MDSIKTEWISSLRVYKGDGGVEKYGVKGSYGVIEIILKDFDLISKDIQNQFKAIKKD